MKEVHDVLGILIPAAQLALSTLRLYEEAKKMKPRADSAGALKEP